MANPLDSARYMLARAKHHVIELEREIGVYLDTDPVTPVAEENAAANEYVYKFKIVKPMPAMLNGTASDAVCNLRSALDQAGYACSIASGGKGKETYFPFGDTPAEVKSRAARGSSEIPPDIFTVMESFKPYKGGDDALWSLNKLANANKHRILSPMAIIADEFQLRNFRVLSSGPMKAAMNPTWDRDNNEMAFAWVGKTSDLNVDCHVEATTLVSFGEIDVIYGLPADGVLKTLIGKVDSILMAVEAEGRRIGIFLS